MDKPILERLPLPLADALGEAARRWRDLNRPWLVGGSCGLALQGVSIAADPRDLDVYVDAPDAVFFHREMSSYAIDEQLPSETGRYRSILSHYQVAGVTLELVAGFEVRAEGALYRVDIAGLLAPCAMRTEAGGAPVGVMPLAHELVFNLLREREDRYAAIAETMRCDLPRHLAALRRIIDRNAFDTHWIRKMSALLAAAPELLASQEA